MPRAKKSTETAKNDRPVLRYARVSHRDGEWGGFCNVRMSEEDKRDFATWWTDEEDMIDAYLGQVLIEGMKYSLAYDHQNGCFIATFTGTAYGTTNFVCSLSARAGSQQEATALLLYKHGVRAKGDWQPFMDAGKGGYSWG